MKEVLDRIYDAQAEFQLETGKTTKVSQKRARLISHQLTKLYKEFRELSLKQ